MKKLNKRIRRANDMLNRYHLTTCKLASEELKVRIPAWDGYAEESVKFANHAATIADFTFEYCAVRGMRTAEFYATKEGQLVKKCIAFCRDVSDEFARRG